MTAQELIQHFNRVYGLRKWPDKYDVDAHTFAHACDFLLKNPRIVLEDNHIAIAIGSSRGLMFKNVELILKG